jgi:superfamily I DNA/RNA helicase
MPVFMTFLLKNPKSREDYSKTMKLLKTARSAAMPSQVLGSIDDNNEPNYALLFKKIKNAMIAQNVIEFSEMVPQALHILEYVPSVLKIEQEYAHFCFCDEFQDVNRYDSA